MKKTALLLALTLIISAFAFTLSSCDEAKDFVGGVADNIEKNTTYDYAIITMPDGTSLKVELAAFGVRSKYSGGGGGAIGATIYYPTYYIFCADGTGYVVSKTNCMLIQDPTVSIDAGSKNVIPVVNCTEATIKNPDGTLSVYQSPKFTEGYPTDDAITIEAEGGFRYAVHPDNVWITFTYEP